MASVLTQIIRVDPDCPDDQLLLPAAMALRNGELVAFPTETVYGLGANALDPAAVARIFTVKGRPGDNPLIVHIASLADLPALVRNIPPLAEKLFKAFSPGPLTLILPKSAAVPDLVTAGLDTVAVRIPAHAVARRLIELAGIPVAAPSANRSGRPSPTRAWHVELDLTGRIPFIIEAGSSHFGLESTVVDVTGPIPVILRPGAITAAAIREVAGDVAGSGIDSGPDDGLEMAPRSPGTKYRHYAPLARLLIADAAEITARGGQVARLAAAALTAGQEVGVFICRQLAGYLPAGTIDLGQADNREPPAGNPGPATKGMVRCIFYSDTPDAAAAGAALFDALRRLDQARVDVIIAEALPDRGIGAAYMNRLRKAAGSGGHDLPARPSDSRGEDNHEC